MNNSALKQPTFQPIKASFAALSLLFAALSLLGSPRTASAQTLIQSTDWTTGSFGSATAGAAGSTTGAGNGEIDNAGGIAVLSPSSPFHLILTPGSAPYSSGQYLLDPASGSVRDEKKTVKWTYGSASALPYIVLRYQGNNTEYMVGGSGNTAIFYDNAGALNHIGTAVTFSATPSVGDAMTTTASVSGASPATLTDTVVDVTTGVTLATETETDSAGPQVAGQTGIMPFGGALSVLTEASYNLAATTPVVIGISSPAWHFSPGNWAGDTGRGGSVYRQTPYWGAYANAYWTTTSNPAAVLNISDQTAGAYISYFLNGIETDDVAVPASGGITLSGIVPNAANVLKVYTRNMANNGWWNESNAWKITNLSVDAGSTPGVAPTWNGKWVKIGGTSITAGINADQNNNPDNLADYSYLLGQALLQQGYDYSVTAMPSIGWIHPGDANGDVPGFYPVVNGVYNNAGSWNMIDASTSLLDSNGHISAYGQTGQEPQGITLEYLTNEVLNSISTSDTQASVLQGLTAVRGAAPNAQLFPIIGFNLYATTIPGYSNSAPYIAAMKNGVAAFQSANPSDTKVTLCDFGPTLASQLLSIAPVIHFNGYGHGVVASDVGGVVFPKLLAPAATLSAPTYLLPTITVSGTNRLLAWTADSTATGYLVLRSVDGRATYQVLATLPATALTYTDTTRPATGTVYYHVVVAH